MDMKDVRIEKIVLNIGCGSKVKPETAKELLERISGAKAVITNAKVRTTWGVGKGKPIGCKVTIRRRNGADELLKRLLDALDRKIKATSFDVTGNVNFGIHEYIDVPGATYDPKFGIMGFDVCVSLERPGYRTKRKKISAKVGHRHRIQPSDAMKFMENKFGVEIEQEKEGE